MHRKTQKWQKLELIKNIVCYSSVFLDVWTFIPDALVKWSFLKCTNFTAIDGTEYDTIYDQSSSVVIFKKRNDEGIRFEF